MSDILADGAAATLVDRREFMKLTATGLVVLIAIDPVTAIPYAAPSALVERKPMTTVRQPTISARFTSGM